MQEFWQNQTLPNLQEITAAEHIVVYQVRQVLHEELLQQGVPGAGLGGEAPEVLQQGSGQEAGEGGLQSPTCGRNEAA